MGTWVRGQVERAHLCIVPRSTCGLVSGGGPLNSDDLAAVTTHDQKEGKYPGGDLPLHLGIRVVRHWSRAGLEGSDARSHLPKVTRYLTARRSRGRGSGFELKLASRLSCEGRSD